MWLFLATEVLFFGGLFLLYAIYRARDPDAIAEASRHAEFLIGTINTVILLSSSAVFVFGLHPHPNGKSTGIVLGMRGNWMSGPDIPVA